MKIYTKTGDTGETSLVGGKRVSKASMRVCAYGDMDELISYIGLLRCGIPESDAFLRNVQAVLMTGSAHIASETEHPRLTPFPYEETRKLEEEIDRLSALIPPMKSFILPSAPAKAMAIPAKASCWVNFVSSGASLKILSNNPMI